MIQFTNIGYMLVSKSATYVGELDRVTYVGELAPYVDLKFNPLCDLCGL